MKFSRRSDQFFQRYEPNCGNMPLLAMSKNPSKIILDPDTEADKDGKIFMKHRTEFRQTDRQANAG